MVRVVVVPVLSDCPDAAANVTTLFAHALPVTLHTENNSPLKGNAGVLIVVPVAGCALIIKLCVELVVEIVSLAEFRTS